MSLDRLYQEVILEHQKDPRSFGRLKDPSIESEGFNPMCGDRVRIGLKIDREDARVLDQAFEGEGCSICMASASMMTEEIHGQDLKSVRQKIENFRAFMQGQGISSELGEDLQSLSGVAQFPVRIKCALLAWTTLKEALEEFEAQKKSESQKEMS
jgi:nitrogen fixation NifU-like protein